MGPARFAPLRPSVTVKTEWIKQPNTPYDRKSHQRITTPKSMFQIIDWFSQSENKNYNCFDGTPGSGGEYEVQDGFGWTNGVFLTLLDKYGSQLDNPYTDSSKQLADVNVLVIVMLSLVAVLLNFMD
ncbi:putative trehalase isoform X2 [Apostichopus japonicus]|uniref:Trehalase n=1 Tax=Stichopus japonicus TaxID=307972 RepID=A0A2G8JFJ1_STIJA|nr:putative trehalase isoform X2 [Apostichopus japonicus]